MLPSAYGEIRFHLIDVGNQIGITDPVTRQLPHFVVVCGTSIHAFATRQLCTGRIETLLVFF